MSKAMPPRHAARNLVTYRKGDGPDYDFASMAVEDRLDMARELLAGTGLVVAKDVGELPAASVQGSVAVVETWNACRAAMLEGGE